MCKHIRSVTRLTKSLNKDLVPTFNMSTCQKVSRPDLNKLFPASQTLRLLQKQVHISLALKHNSSS